MIWEVDHVQCNIAFEELFTNAPFPIIEHYHPLMIQSKKFDIYRCETAMDQAIFITFDRQKQQQTSTFVNVSTTYLLVNMSSPQHLYVSTNTPIRFLESQEAQSSSLSLWSLQIPLSIVLHEYIDDSLPIIRHHADQIVIGIHISCQLPPWHHYRTIDQKHGDLNHPPLSKPTFGVSCEEWSLLPRLTSKIDTYIMQYPNITFFMSAHATNISLLKKLQLLYPSPRISMLRTDHDCCTQSETKLLWHLYAHSVKCIQFAIADAIMLRYTKAILTNVAFDDAIDHANPFRPQLQTGTDSLLWRHHRLFLLLAKHIQFRIIDITRNASFLADAYSHIKPFPQVIAPVVLPL